MSEQTLPVTCRVNDADVVADVPARTLLSDWLRAERRLTGTHVGCEHGVCGACTVIVDGAAVRSCLMLAVQVDGAVVETVESLGTADDLSELQQTLSDAHGLQCGFCTPGILMSLEAAHRCGTGLDEVTDEVLGGHVCRCTGYQNIRAAITTYWSGRAGADARKVDQ